MEKFYIRSGNNQLVTLAKSPDEAALRFVQKLLQPAIRSAKDLNKLPTMIDQAKVAKLLKKIGPRILVSQTGFADSNSGQFSSNAVVARWRKQVASLEKLLRKMK